MASVPETRDLPEPEDHYREPERDPPGAWLGVALVSVALAMVYVPLASWVGYRTGWSAAVASAACARAEARP